MVGPFYFINMYEIMFQFINVTDESVIINVACVRIQLTRSRVCCALNFVCFPKSIKTFFSFFLFHMMCTMKSAIVGI